MGHGNYSNETFTRKYTEATASGRDFFDHTSKVSSGQAQARTHELLDPKRANSVGKVVRESFDSVAHPNSLPIGVFFDVTGSMKRTPRVFVHELAALMRRLTSEINPDSHVLLGAIGDAYSDTAPLQVGQFEANNALDDVLSQIFLEGGGGGSKQESYELGMYFMARHADIDSLNKRKKRGYLFFIGDELPYNQVDARVVKNVIGDTIPSDIPTEDILKELQQKFEVYWLFPNQTDNYSNPRIRDGLRTYFGANLIFLEDPNLITDTILATVAIREHKDVNKIIEAAGSKADILRASLDQVVNASKMNVMEFI